MTRTKAKIEIKNLRKAFGPKVVLDGVNLTVHEGESVVIIGGSGTGKSVLLKCVLGIIRPDAGEILVDGVDVTRLSAREREEALRKFGMLFQGGALFDSLKVWENISFRLLQTKQVSAKEARRIAEEKLAAVGLRPEVAALSPSELSGGMQKRVALARAIAAKPEIIFFDEPTTGLDPIMADVINNLIVDCTRELGATTLTITHDMASARKIAHTIGMLYQGKLIWQGAADTIDATDNAFVQQFIHGRAEGPIQVDVSRSA